VLCLFPLAEEYIYAIMKLWYVDTLGTKRENYLIYYVLFCEWTWPADRPTEKPWPSKILAIRRSRSMRERRALAPPFTRRRSDFYIPKTPLHSKNITNENIYMNVFFISYIYKHATSSHPKPELFETTTLTLLLTCS
jgi:hypothetical protein